MTDGTNRQWILAERPEGKPEEKDFELVESTIPTPDSGEVLVRIRYLSVDPYMRSRLGGEDRYMASPMVNPWETGAVIPGGCVGEVVESNDPSLSEGDIVSGRFQWAEFVTATPSQMTPVDPTLAPISTALGVLGMTGLTAYFGMLEIGDPKPGDTVMVSGAAGGVGSIACQIAKMNGCRVIGTAGSDEKVDYLENELEIDTAINYNSSDIETAITDACPDGIDVYFDNVGGEITDAVILELNAHGRVAVCGQISLYNEEKTPIGPRKLWKLVEKEAKIEGFTFSGFAPRHREARQRMARWIDDGRVQYRETIVEGFENVPEAFLGLFEGENIGKMLVKLGES